MEVDHISLKLEGEPEDTCRHYEYHIYTVTHRQVVSQEKQDDRAEAALGMALRGQVAAC